MPGSIPTQLFPASVNWLSLPRVHAAFQWFHLHDRRMMQWQQELVVDRGASVRRGQACGVVG